MQTTAKRPLWLNSVVAFALASVIAVVLHETAHAIAGLGSRPILYSFQVDYADTRDTAAKITSLAAGPLFSLVFGLAIFFASHRWGTGFVRLFFIWLGLISAQNFFGYLVIAPFGSVGDTGQILELTNAPGFVSIIGFVLGAAGTVWLSWLFLGQIRRYTQDADEVRSIGIFPWLAGTGIAIARTLGEALQTSPAADVLIVVAAGAAASGIFAPILSTMWQRVNPPYEPLELKTPIVPIAITVVLYALSIFVLARGINLF